MSNMEVLHCDLNNFYASAEIAEHPELNAEFIAVSGNPETRHGIILAKNTAAKNAGVKTGEPIWQAKKKCPDLVLLPSHPDLYVYYSRKVRDIYCRFTDKVESFGLDECWLDVTSSGIFGTPLEIAEKLRQIVKEETGLTISVGVSFTKTFAKLGSDMKKPDATTVIDRGNFREKVWPLKVSEMLGIGGNTEKKLNAMAIYTLGDLAAADEYALKRTFGVLGERMKNAANGRDCDPVRNADIAREIKSVGHGTTTLRDMLNYEDADKVISFLSEMVATRLRRYKMKCTTIHINVRRNDLSYSSKQTTVKATYVATEISAAASKLLRESWKCFEELPLRTVTVTAAGLTEVSGGVQMSIFDNFDEKKQQLEISLDKIRKKYGFAAIKRADILNNDLIADKFCEEEDLLPFKR